MAHVSPFLNCPAKDYTFDEVKRTVTQTITASTVGFGVPESRAHPHQEGGALGAQPFELPRDLHEVIVGTERVRDRDGQRPVSRRERERLGPRDRELPGGRREAPVAQPHCVPPDQEAEAEQLASQRQQLRRASLLVGPHRRIPEQRRLDHPAAAG